MGDKKGGSQRKGGRNKKWCLAYETSGRREQNKRKKLIRHFRKHPHDIGSMPGVKELARIGYHLPKEVLPTARTQKGPALIPH